MEHQEAQTQLHNEALLNEFLRSNKARMLSDAGISVPSKGLPFRSTSWDVDGVIYVICAKEDGSWFGFSGCRNP
jgi:hypothetical protein